MAAPPHIHLNLSALMIDQKLLVSSLFDMFFLRCVSVKHIKNALLSTARSYIILIFSVLLQEYKPLTFRSNIPFKVQFGISAGSRELVGR